MLSLSKIAKNKKAFSLLEAVISIAIFIIFAFGIYGSIQYIYKVIYSSRIQIIETALLNEQMEIIRNMDFNDVGVVSSAPVGILTRNSYVTRNDIDFVITRSIRNVDDSADGLIELGTDSNPNDYKLVFLEARCVDCSQQKSVSISSYVADSFPESTTNSGALFVNVTDSNFNPVQGAEVHIVSNEPSIDIDMIDTTDNNGQLKIYSITSCYKCYEITVSKTGYLSDRTTSSSEFVSSAPVNEHATVYTEDVTDTFFQIDLASQVNIQTLNEECMPVGNVSLGVNGGGLLATAEDVYRLDTIIQTNGSGVGTLNNLHWGDYNFTVNNYNYLGAIPAQPLIILANSTQNQSIIVAPSTVRSLSILITDTSQNPISDAKVTLTSGSDDYIVYTGLGYFFQNDWSGLQSHEFYDSNFGYWLANNVEYNVVDNPLGLRLEKIAEGLYENSGYLESATFDFGSVDVDYINLNWQVDQPSSTSIKFQIATSNSSTPSFWEYLGPDGSNSSYYDSTTQDINTVHDDNRYLRYKVYFDSVDVDPVSGYSRYTPTVSEVDIFYVKICSLPGQAYFGTVPESTNNTITIEATGYETVNLTGVEIGDNVTTSTELNAL